MRNGQSRGFKKQNSIAIGQMSHSLVDFLMEQTGSSNIGSSNIDLESGIEQRCRGAAVGGCRVLACRGCPTDAAFYYIRFPTGSSGGSLKKFSFEAAPTQSPPFPTRSRGPVVQTRTRYIERQQDNAASFESNNKSYPLLFFSTSLRLRLRLLLQS